MDVNEDVAILEKLGILESKLECPNKEVSAKDCDRRENVGNKQQNSLAGSNDGWSNLLFSGLSSEESDDESDTLFERPQGGRFVTNNGLGQKRLKKFHKKARNGRQGHGGGESPGLPNNWKLFSLLSAALFLGFTQVYQQPQQPSSAIPFLPVQFPHENNGTLFKMLALHAFMFFLGSYAGALCMLKLNPYTILLIVMILFMSICAYQPYQAIDHTGIYYLLCCTIQAIMAGVIQRGILLISPLWITHSNRVLFLAYTFLAFGASIGFHLPQQANIPVLAPNYSTVSSSTTSPNIGGPNSAGFQQNNKTSWAAPSFLPTELSPDQGLSLMRGVNHIDVDNAKANITLPTNISGTTTAVQPTSEMKPGEKDQLIFKTKTEENAFRRKELEMKKKKEEKEQAEMPQKGREEKEAGITVVEPKIEGPIAGNTTSGTTNDASKLRPKRKTLPTKNHSSSAPHPASAITSRLEFAILIVLILPLIFGFCCCCILDHPIYSSQYKHLSELNSPISAHPEQLNCCLLSFLIWTIHFLVTSMFQFALTDRLAIEGAFTNLSPISLFWLFAGIYQLILTIWPVLALRTLFLHSLYFLLILVCSISHFLMPSNNAFKMEVGIAIMALSSVLPFAIYAWYCKFSKGAQLHISARFIFSMAFSKLAGPLVFVWLIDTEEGNWKATTFFSSIAFLGLGALVLSYALFLLLSTKLRKNERKKQIMQLSGALNGKKTGNSTKNRKRKTKVAGRTKKGTYSLLESGGRSANGGNAADFPSFSVRGLDSTTSGEDEADFEMDSIEESEPKLILDNMRRERAESLAASSVEDLI